MASAAFAEIQTNWNSSVPPARDFIPAGDLPASYFNLHLHKNTSVLVL